MPSLSCWRSQSVCLELTTKILHIEWCSCPGATNHVGIAGCYRNLSTHWFTCRKLIEAASRSHCSSSLRSLLAEIRWKDWNVDIEEMDLFFQGPEPSPNGLSGVSLSPSYHLEGYYLQLCHQRRRSFRQQFHNCKVQQSGKLSGKVYLLRTSARSRLTDAFEFVISSNH